MKTIVETDTGLSKYLLADDVAVAMNVDNVVVGEPPQFIVADLNASSATVYESVTAPDDWIGNKYTFDGTAWVLNPAWVDLSDVV
jgi:hypothetical protein